jgi:arginine/ornithine N-succinyltransferase beta subunit
MSVHRDTIRTIMNARVSTISASPISVSLWGAQGKPTLIAAGKVADFRAVLTPATLSNNGLLVLPDALSVLEVPMDAEVRFWQKPETRNAAQQTLVKAQL